MDTGRDASGGVRGTVRRRGVRASRLSEEDTGHAARGAGVGKAKARGAAETPKIDCFVSVWDAIADSSAQAANLAARAELMRGIAKIVQRSKWTQADAASRAGISQPRMNDLLRGRISKFSLDALVGIADALGQRVSVRLTRASLPTR